MYSKQFVLLLAIYTALFSNQFNFLESLKLKLIQTTVTNFRPDICEFFLHNYTDPKTKKLFLSSAIQVRQHLENYHVQFSINIQKSSNEANMTALDRSVNICDQMRKRKGSDFLMQIVFKGLTDFGNFSTKCPIKIGYYYFKDFPVDNDLLPKFLRIYQGIGYVTFKNYIVVQKKVVEFNRAEYVVEVS